MYLQFTSEGDEPYRASGARLFKFNVALSTGIGFLVGAIVGVSLFTSIFHDTSTTESSNLVALPLTRQARGPIYGIGIKHVQQNNAYNGLASSSAVHRVRAEGEDRYAKPPNDPFYGVGAKQVRQSNTYTGLPSLPTALPSWSEEHDRYAKGPNDAFTGMGMGLEKPSAPFPVQGREVSNTYAGLSSLPTALPSWSAEEDRYAKGPNDAFTGMGMGLEKPSAPFPVEGREVSNTYAGVSSLPTALPSWSAEDRYAKGPNDAFTGMGMGLEKPNAPFPIEGRDVAKGYGGLPSVPTALPSKNYAGLRSSYGVRSKEGQESTIEFESLRV